MARRPSAQKECSPEGRPLGRACMLQGKGFLDCRAASHGPPGHSLAGELREYGCVGSLNSNWASFSALAETELEVYYPTYTHQTALLPLGPAAPTLCPEQPLCPPSSLLTVLIPRRLLSASLCLYLHLYFCSLCVYYSFCLSLFLPLCFCLCLSLPSLVSAISDLPNSAARSGMVLAGLGWTVGHTLDPQADRPQFCSCHRAGFPEASQACKCPYPAPKSLPPAFWEPLLTVLRSCALTSLLPQAHPRASPPCSLTQHLICDITGGLKLLFGLVAPGHQDPASHWQVALGLVLLHKDHGTWDPYTAR